MSYNQAHAAAYALATLRILELQARLGEKDHRAAANHESGATSKEKHRMCDTQITPQVATIDKLPLGARVFIEGKNRPLHVAESVSDVAGQLGDAAVTVTNLNGEQTAIPSARVVSVVAPTPSERRKVDVPASVLWGKKYTFRGLSAHNSDCQRLVPEDMPVRVPEGDDENNYIAIVAEDLADALVLVVNVETGDVLYANPAEPDRSIRRLVKAARLVAEAEVLMLQESMPQQ